METEIRRKGGKIIMDWRDRKYYVVRFSPDSYDMRIRILKNIEGVKLYPSTNHKINTKFPDEKEPRGYYHVLIGCKTDIKDIVEFELRKAERNDWWVKWKEVQRKRCNHCMDC